MTNLFISAQNEKHGESEGRFEISELHQNAGFFSSSLGEDQQLDTVSDGAVSSLPFPKRSHSACDIRAGRTFILSEVSSIFLI